MVPFGDGYILDGHYYGNDDPEKWRRFWDMCAKTDETLRLAALDRKIEELRLAGKRWKHVCPECGKEFENDEPEKGYLCYACGREALRRALEKL